MHLRISIILCCAVLLGIATTTQANSERSFSDSIDIDNDLEGSGGGTEVSRDLESSGSGYGPDDEDSTVPPVVRKINVNEEHTVVPQPDLNENSAPKSEKPTSTKDRDYNNLGGNDGVIMNPKPEDRPTSFFAQPGILAAVIGGAVVGLLCAILVVMFIVYRMRKKDEGSYPLDEPKRSPTSNSYSRGNNKEFYA